MRFHPSRAALALLPLLLAIAAGCGDDGTGPSPLETGTTTFILGDGDSGPAAGAAIVHGSASGEVLATRTADAAGRVDLEITEGDMITARQPRRPQGSGGRSTLFTVVGVRPDDVLDFQREDFPNSSPDHLVAVEGTIPDPQDTVIFSNGCISGGGRVTLPYELRMYDGCGGDSGLLNVWFYTTLDQEKQVYAHVTDFPKNASGTTTVDLTGRWRNDWQDVALTLPDPGFDLSSFSLSPWPERDGATFHNLETASSFEGDEPTSTHTLRLPRDFVDHVRLEVLFDGESRQSYLKQRVPVSDATASLAMDVAIPSIEIEIPDFSNPLRPRLRWSVDTDGLSGDMIRLTLVWKVGDERYTWRIFLPPTARSFQLPELPTGFFPSVPVVMDAANEMTIYVKFEDDSFVSDYDQARRSLLYGRSPFSSVGSQPGYDVSALRWIAAPGVEGDSLPRQGEPDVGFVPNQASR